MTSSSAPPSPWCLHWGRDGELQESDHQDLFRTLALNEHGLARDGLAQLLLNRRQADH
jgi:hypothetical protein